MIEYFHFNRPHPVRAGSVASSSISASGGSINDEISDNVDDDDTEESLKMSTSTVGALPDMIPPVMAQTYGIAGNMHTPTHRASSDSEKGRRRPASVPLRKSLSQGGVPESELVHPLRGIFFTILMFICMIVESNETF